MHRSGKLELRSMILSSDEQRPIVTTEVQVHLEYRGWQYMDFWSWLLMESEEKNVEMQ